MHQVSYEIEDEDRREYRDVNLYSTVNPMYKIKPIRKYMTLLQML